MIADIFRKKPCFKNDGSVSWENKVEFRKQCFCSFKELVNSIGLVGKWQIHSYGKHPLVFSLVYQRKDVVNFNNVKFCTDEKQNRLNYDNQNQTKKQKTFAEKDIEKRDNENSIKKIIRNIRQDAPFSKNLKNIFIMFTHLLFLLTFMVTEYFLVTKAWGRNISFFDDPGRYLATWFFATWICHCIAEKSIITNVIAYINIFVTLVILFGLVFSGQWVTLGGLLIVIVTTIVAGRVCFV